MVEEEPKQPVSPQTPVKRKASKELLPPKNVRRKLMFDEKEESQAGKTADRDMDSANRHELNSMYEKDRQRCIEQYNFDPQTGTPLNGRYSWMKVNQRTYEVNSEVSPKVSKKQ